MKDLGLVNLPFGEDLTLGNSKSMVMFSLTPQGSHFVQGVSLTSKG